MHTGADTIARPLTRSPARQRVCALACGVFALAGAAAGAREAPPAPGTPRDIVLPAKSDETLPNGLHATYVPFGTVPKATVLIVLRTGEIDDGGRTGLANLAAALLTEGAGARDAAELARRAADMGGAIDVEPRPDDMSFTLDVLAERAPEAIELLGDVLRRPRLPGGELPRLKADLTRQVALARSQAQSIAGERYAQLLWGTHPYGRTLPDDAAIAALTLADVQGFVAANFGAARAHVYVAGRFEHAAVAAAIARAFGDWPAGAPPTRNVPAGARARRVVLLDRPGAAQSTVMLGLPVGDPGAPDFMQLSVTNALLGGSLLSRLQRNLREDKGYTYDASSHLTPYVGTASWTLATDVNTPQTAAALAEAFREIERLRHEPPAADELARTQNYRAGIFLLGASSRGGVLAQLAYLDLHGLPLEWLTGYVRRIYAVTPSDVERVAARELDPAAMTLVVVGDRKRIERELRALPALDGASFD